ncbi:MAG: proprotein convertase P-domain-containing protein [Candidatus Kaiserbacteria bacterium]|nr:proprotein convertase P-domain-containing protein [Candidatus Kaiserbacteria bacterium]
MKTHTNPIITISIAVCTVLAALFFVPSVSASQVPEGGGIAVPNLITDTSFASVPNVSDIDRVMETVWGSILGNEQGHPALSQILDEVTIPISGIFPIQGEDHVFLGIGYEYWENHGGKNLYRQLSAQLPDVPLHVAPSAGVNRQSNRGGLPAVAVRDVQPIALFRDPVSFSQKPRATLSDNTKQQVVVGRIDVPNDVIVGSVNVSLDITHPFRSDLVVDLVAPSGATVTLFDGVREGIDPTDNLVGPLPATTELQGQRAQGTWKLRVGDYGQGDTGTVNSWNLTITPAQDAPETEEPVNLFLETFQEGLGAWQGPKWEAVAFEGVPGEGPGNIVAKAQRCGICFLTLKSPIDLSAHETVTLSFSRYLDHGLGDFEFLGIDIATNGAYQRLGNWSGRDADSEWHQETFTLSGDQIGDSFSIRFFGITNTDLAAMAIDNVMITAAPGSVVVEPTPDPEPEPTETTADLAVTAVTARPETTKPGSRILLRTTVKNTDAPTDQYNVSFYRHTQATDTPQVGGVPVANRMISLETNKERIFFISAVTHTVPATYHYYACIQEISNENTANNCASTTVTVQGEETPEPETPEEVAPEPEPEPTEEPETGSPTFSITSVTAAPHLVHSKDLVTLTISVTNTGTAIGTTTITVYRTVSPAFVLERTQEPNTTTITLAPNESVTITSTHEAPEVSRRSFVRYEVCTDVACSKKIPVGVQAEDLGPPYENCQQVPEQPNPMGGDRLDVETSPGSGNFVCAGTITLGGVEDTDDVRGFIASGHAVAPVRNNRRDYLQTGQMTAHGIYVNEPIVSLGTVFKAPRIVGRDILQADAAFVAYPKDASTNTYRETLAPLKIRGEGDTVYTVIGSREPIEGEAIWISGSRSRIPLKNIAGGTTEIAIIRLDADGREFLEWLYYATSLSDSEETRNGDSGAPVYTTPDENGNVHILGVFVGTIDDDSHRSIYSSWENVEDSFDLKPVGGE